MTILQDNSDRNAFIDMRIGVCDLRGEWRGFNPVIPRSGSKPGVCWRRSGQSVYSSCCFSFQCPVKLPSLYGKKESLRCAPGSGGKEIDHRSSDLRLDDEVEIDVRRKGGCCVRRAAACVRSGAAGCASLAIKSRALGMRVNRRKNRVHVRVSISVPGSSDSGKPVHEQVRRSTWSHIDTCVSDWSTAGKWVLMSRVGVSWERVRMCSCAAGNSSCRSLHSRETGLHVRDVERGRTVASPVSRSDRCKE